MKFKKFKKIVKLLKNNLSASECHLNTLDDINDLIKDKEKVDDISHDILRFENSSEKVIEFLLDTIFNKENAELINSFVYRKCFGEDVPSPYNVKNFYSLKDLYNYIEKK